MTALALHRKALILKGLAAVTIAAPVLAGLAQQGWAMVAALAAAYLAAQVLGKPWVLPTGPDAAAWGRLAVLAASQGAVVLVFYGAGFALSAVGGWRPEVPLWLPPVMVLAAGALARAVWRPIPPAAEAMLDDAIRRIEGMAGDAGEPGADFDPVLRPVADLPPDTPDAVAEAAVAAAMETLEPDWFDASERLIRLLDIGGAATVAARRGVILWGIDPARVASGRFGYPMCTAWEVTWTDPDMLMLYATRALPVVQAMPERWEDYPRHHVVGMAIDDANGAAVNAALDALATALRDALPPEERRLDDDAYDAAPAVLAERRAQAVLADLDAGMDDAAILSHLAALSESEYMAAADALDTRARAGDAFAARVLVLHATAPAVAMVLSGLAPTLRAFDRAGEDGPLNALFAARAAAMIDAAPETVHELPEAHELRGRARAVPAAAAALRRLADRREAAA